MTSALLPIPKESSPVKEKHQAASSGVHLLHVVGPVTDEVFSFLGPATRALANNGHSQQIVVIDTPRHRHNVEKFDEYASVVRIAEARNPLAEWVDVFKACKIELHKNGLGAVHVHGLVPFLLVSIGLRSANVQAPVVYSPHGSRSLGTLRFVGKLAMLAVHSATRHGRTSAIVTVPREISAFEKWEAAAIIENPVSNFFFSVPRVESSKPTIVTGGRHSNVRSVEIFSQLAVLLSGEELGLEFNWIGTVPEIAQRRLQAASVNVSSISNDQECAGALAGGWMYVAPWSTRGFPLFLVQAMAAGLPCVALDCEQHREVIEDGKNGFLCTSEQEMVSKIATLVDNPDLRLEMGNAAKTSAAARFSEATFEDKLMTAYSTRW
ncbi:glycosyltransferase [Variovorax sp. RHLX14]|uniref:glycosyltransferase n=1 Tax=Variovorax sp. RHLX14 TaxID=1259731 RepID=UPI003F46F6CE